MRKHLGNLLFLFVLLFAIGVINRNAVEAAESSESDFEVNVDGVITKYNGAGGDVVIPEMVNGVRVTKIGREVFMWNNKITTVFIPDGVTSIGEGAFFGCSNLYKIAIPDSIVFIGKNAFRNCSELTHIVIPNNVTSINSYTFMGCKGISNISIPHSVTSIGDFAFSKCSSLTSIFIPESVTSIGGAAFEYCSELTNVHIPDTVTHIGFNTFKDCVKLTDFTVPNSIISIGTQAFQNCNSLNSISIPHSVALIGCQAFGECDSLKSVYIYNDSTKISDLLNGENVPIIGANTPAILYGYKGSTIEAHAKKFNLNFQYLPDDSNKPLENISLNKTNITLNIDQTSILSVNYSPTDTTDSTSIKWTSSNPAIAKIYSNGKVKGMSSGTATITAHVGDLTADCIVTVR